MVKITVLGIQNRWYTYLVHEELEATASRRHRKPSLLMPTPAVFPLYSYKVFCSTSTRPPKGVMKAQSIIHLHTNIRTFLPSSCTGVSVIPSLSIQCSLGGVGLICFWHKLEV